MNELSPLTDSSFEVKEPRVDTGDDGVIEDAVSTLSGEAVRDGPGTSLGISRYSGSVSDPTVVPLPGCGDSLFGVGLTGAGKA